MMKKYSNTLGMITSNRNALDIQSEALQIGLSENRYYGGKINKKIGRFIKKAVLLLTLNQWSVKYPIFRAQNPLDLQISPLYIPTTRKQCRITYHLSSW